MSVVASELGICALEGRVAVRLWLLDAVSRVNDPGFAPDAIALGSEAENLG